MSIIQERIEQFVNDIHVLVGHIVEEALVSALGGLSQKRPKTLPASALRIPQATGLGRGKGQKRPPSELEALTEKLHAYVRKNPGERIEQIGKAMGVHTRELTLPAKKLIASKRLSTKGHKRSTTYYAK